MQTDNIVIVGGGSSGWMTAATLIKAFPQKNITVIESLDHPIIGVGESTLGFIKRWTRFIGLEEKDFFPATDASYKLSIKFTDFFKKDSGSFHYPFGDPVIDDNRNPFFDWHLKKFFYPDTDVADMVDCLYPAAALFKNNKFSNNVSGEFDNFNLKDGVAYHFDATKFGIWLRENRCKPLGVKHLTNTVVDVKVNHNGIEYLTLDNDQLVIADLYIDCTGFKSMLLGEALQTPFESYNQMLPNNKAWAAQVPYKNRAIELEGYTNCTAIENGWCWNIPLWTRLGTGYVYSDKFISDEQALEEFKKYLGSDKMTVPRSKSEINSLNFKNIKMRVGIHEKTFVKNVVAIGLSAAFIEPLESNGLFSVHEFLFKLVDILHRGEINQFDRDMYNISVKNQFDSFAKFVSLHYALSHRNDTEYWVDIQNKSFSDRAGDPHTPNATKIDNYYDIIVRYMEQWSHSLDAGAGIPFIATGLHLNMMNISRVELLEHKWNVDLKKEIDIIDQLWDQRKKQWNTVSNNVCTLEQYLENNLHKLP
jgi:tryptophan halogenase